MADEMTVGSAAIDAWLARANVCEPTPTYLRSERPQDGRRQDDQPGRSGSACADSTIRSAEVFVTSPGRSFVTLRVDSVRARIVDGFRSVRIQTSVRGSTTVPGW